jgi:hypothetical protein
VQVAVLPKKMRAEIGEVKEQGQQVLLPFAEVLPFTAALKTEIDDSVILRNSNLNFRGNNKRRNS